jgi:RNA-splicing ligase RtcB
MSSEKMKKLSQNPDFQKIRNKASAKTFENFCKTEKFKEQSKHAGKRGKKYLCAYNKSKTGIEKSTEVGNRVYECPVCNKILIGPFAVNSHKKMHPDLTFQEFKLTKNHKIKSIEILNCEPTKVYCLKVEEHSNFALAAGVFVHNCGMSSLNIGSALPISYQELDHKIRQRIPFGFDTNERSVIDFAKEFPWKKVNATAQNFALSYQRKFNSSITLPRFDFNWFEKKCDIIGCDLGRAIKSLCSLGGGNHFIELGLSTKNEYWLTIHTGSRNLGKCICEYWQDIAIKKLKRGNKEDRQSQIEKLKNTLKGKELFEAIKQVKEKEPLVLNFSDDLCYLEGQDAQQYLFDMIFSQIYAQVNRQLISKKIVEILNVPVIDSIETVHNFIDFEDFIIRKGSIRSYENERMIIPFNMRDGILVCTGKSNPEWNFSAPHGAGRLLSRSQAKKKLDMNEFSKQMSAIFSTSVNMSTLDEAPDAYKNPKIIEEAIEPTALIIERLVPVMNMKDSKGTDD